MVRGVCKVSSSLARANTSTRVVCFAWVDLFEMGLLVESVGDFYVVGWRQS
jgi:hypothetical protein